MNKSVLISIIILISYIQCNNADLNCISKCNTEYENCAVNGAFVGQSLKQCQEKQNGCRKECGYTRPLLMDQQSVYECQGECKRDMFKCQIGCKTLGAKCNLDCEFTYRTCLSVKCQ